MKGIASMKEIPWERTAEGASAHLRDNGTRVVLPVLSFFKIMEAKLTSLHLISADFHDTTVVFERQVQVHLEAGEEALCLGLYAHDPEDELPEEVRDRVPTWCLRQARWERRRDVEQFRQTANMKAYVQGPGLLDSRLVFTVPDVYPEINQLTEEARTLVRQGMALTAAPRAQVEWSLVSLDMKDGTLGLSLSYAPLREGNDELERWIRQWQKQFAAVDYAGGLLPDAGCSISYPFSLQEGLESFPEMGFEEFRLTKAWKKDASQ
jgi:hypothetical protein